MARTNTPERPRAGPERESAGAAGGIRAGPGAGGPAPARPSAATRAALAEGCRRFDAGRFFEAHEVWEDAWRGERDEPRRALQGLIQIAAAFHKGLVQGRPEGMARLLEAGLAKLGVDRLGDVDLSRLRPEVARWRAAARRWADGGERPRLPAPRLGRDPSSRG